jgi:hypothetical protein
MPHISMAILAPRSRDTVKGTTRGAIRVSRNIKERESARSPWLMETQIRPETAVGIEKSNTYPDTVSGAPGKIREQARNARVGITIWVEKKKRTRGMGLVMDFPISLNRKLRALEKVMAAKSQETKGLRVINTWGSRSPRTTAVGVRAGINRSSTVLSDLAI